MATVTTTSRHFTASMVVVSGPSVLLVHHRATGKLMFPGGHIDPDEAPHEAAVREVHEETGISVALLGFPLYDLPPGFEQLPTPWMTVEMQAPAKPDRGPGKPAEPAHWHIDLLFIGEPVDPQAELRPARSEVHTAEWVRVVDLERYGRSRYDYRAEVPEVARRAVALVRGDSRPAVRREGGSRSVVIGNLTAGSVEFGDRR